MQSEVTYTVTFTNLWSATDHVSFPGNAHFSPIVAIAHNEFYDIYQEGQLASEALEPLAELGQTGLLVQEIAQAQDQGFVSSLAVGSNFFPDNVGDSIQFQITVSQDHSLLSFASMIAPSPDWIVGLDSLNLFDGNQFVQSLDIDLYAINAGTENGDFPGNFSINNSATNPQEAIVSLQNRTGFTKAFANVRIERQ